ncbi:MAG: hypothetical protein V4587_12435, partial [Acidobacteriota bacterium]
MKRIWAAIAVILAMGATALCQTSTVNCNAASRTFDASGGVLHVPCSLVVTPAPPQTMISVATSPASVGAGAGSNPTWATSRAATMTISPALRSVALSGPAPVSPDATTSYILTATNTVGATVTSSATVTVMPVVVAPPPAPCKGKAISSAAAITKSGSYYLSAPIAGSIPIEASGVTVDLCGQTVTYSTMPAFYGCISGGKILPALTQTCANPGSYGGVHLTNSQFPAGGIVQAATSSAGIPAVLFGDENQWGAPQAPGTIDHLTIAVSQPAAQAIRLPYPGSGWNVSYNVVISTVASIQFTGEAPTTARYRFGGYMIWTGGGGNVAGSGNTFSYNTINGAPQGGITDANQKSKFLNNTCTMNSHYSNDYCVLAPADNQEVGFNTTTILPGAPAANGGRGFDAEGVNANVHDNVADVWEGNGNTEYSGCELDGSYGIRSKFNPQVNGGVVSGTFTNNKIKVEAKYCPAVGFEMTNLPTTSNVIFNGNTITTVSGPGGLDAPIGFDQTAAPITGTGNVLSGTYGVYVNWDGAVETIPVGQTWNVGTALINDQDGGTASAANFKTPMSLSILDNPANKTVVCGGNATGVNSVAGKVVKTCGHR